MAETNVNPDTLSTGIQAGARDFRSMIDHIAATTDLAFADVDIDAPDQPDPRDYRAFAAHVRMQTQAAILSGDPARRDGFFLAMAQLLSMFADGVSPGRDWDPATEIPRLAGKLDGQVKTGQAPDLSNVLHRERNGMFDVAALLSAAEERVDELGGLRRMSVDKDYAHNTLRLIQLARERVEATQAAIEPFV